MSRTYKIIEKWTDVWSINWSQNRRGPRPRLTVNIDIYQESAGVRELIDQVVLENHWGLASSVHPGSVMSLLNVDLISRSEKTGTDTLFLLEETDILFPQRGAHKVIADSEGIRYMDREGDDIVNMQDYGIV